MEIKTKTTLGVLLFAITLGCTNVKSSSESSATGASASYESSTPSNSGEKAIGTSDFLVKGIAYVAMLALMIPLAN